MLRQCRNPKCIGSKKSLTSHKYKNKKREPTPPSTSRRSSLDNSTASRDKRTQKRTKSKSKRSKDGSKNSRTSFNESRNCHNKKCHASQSTSKSSTSYSSRKLRATSTKSNTFERVSDSSRDCKKQICTCREERRSIRGKNSHGNSQSTPVKRSKRRRKRSRRRRKKTSKRESDRPRHDCFTTLCVCIRGRSSDELRACKCTSSHEIPSRCECHSIKDGQKETKQVTRRNALKNDTQEDRYTAGPSTSERKPVKHSRELSPAKPNEERSRIIRGLDIVRRRIHRFSEAIRSVTTRQQ